MSVVVIYGPKAPELAQMFVMTYLSIKNMAPPNNLAPTQDGVQKKDRNNENSLTSSPLN